MTGKVRMAVHIVCLIAIFLCGFYLRHDAIKKTAVVLPLRADAGDYFMYAFNLRYKHTYSSQVGNPMGKTSPVKPDAIRYPGYPLFLTLLVNDIPGEKVIDKILFAQMLLSTLTILIAYLFFKFFLPPPGCLFATLLVALSPHLIIANSYVLTETLFCFYLSILGLVMGYFVSKPSAFYSGAIGLVLGMINLVRPSLQYFPLFLILFFCFQYGGKKGIRFSIALLVCFFIINAPWTIRNMHTMGKASDSERMAMFLQHGMYPDFKYKNLPESYGFPYNYDPKTDDLNRNTSGVIKEILHRLKEEPLRHMTWYFFKKPVALWSWNMVQGRDAFVYPVSKSPYFYNPYHQWSSRLMYALHIPLILLCTLGALMIWFPSVSKKLSVHSALYIKLVSILLLYYTAIHMIGVPLPRYSVPFRPFFYGIAVFSVYSIVSVLIRETEDSLPV